MEKQVGRKAVVVGASSGMGRELTKVLVSQGYTVGVMARRVELLQQLQAELGAGVVVEAADVADWAGAMKALRQLIERMGGVELVVLNAGTGDINPNLEWGLEHSTIATNVTGFAALANVAMAHFLEVGAGHLVGISSIGALRGGRESPAYNASKAFVSNYLEGLRQKVCHQRLPIVVTDIQPGFVQTAMAKGEGIFWSAPTETAAWQIYGAICKKRRHAYITRRWRLVAWILKAMPSWLYERM